MDPAATPPPPSDVPPVLPGVSSTVIPPGAKPQAAVNPAQAAVNPAQAGGSPVIAKSGDPASVATLLPGEEPVVVDEEHPAHHGPGFFNQPWVQNILPLATALLFHVVIIGVGLLLARTYKELVNPNKEQVIIPESKIAEKPGFPGGIPHPGPSGDKSRDVMQMLNKESKDDGLNDKPSTSTEASMAGGGKGANDASDFGIGSNANAGRGSSTGSGAGSGFGGGGGGPMAPFGPPGGGSGQLGPKSNFFGVGGNANKIVYLCDKSGSMLGVFNSLKAELKHSVNDLTFGKGARQQFNVIFFSDAGPEALFKDPSGKPVLEYATEANRKAAMDFIEGEFASGQTEPLSSIKAAIDMKPELLQVLTDGFDNVSNFDEVINAFKANKEAKMKVNTILLESAEDPQLRKVLQKIADNGGGKLQVISKASMN